MAKNKSKAGTISNPETLKLWVRAGGRCEFRGCNKYLLKDEKLTGCEINLADRAHIVAQSKSGARGDDSLSGKERDLAPNLMLLCSEHHNKIIDKGALQKEFPKELLLKMKSEHEERVHYLTSLGPDCETAVISLIGGIRGGVPAISEDEIRRAVLDFELYPKFFGSGNCMHIDLAGLADQDTSAFWKSGQEKIKEEFQRQVIPGFKKNEFKSLSVFALARIPFLIYFGYLLDDKIKTILFQRHRDGKDCWRWREGVKKIDFESSIIQTGSDKNKVALVLSISGKIEFKNLPPEIDKQFTVFEITPAGVMAGTDILRCFDSIEEFCKVYRSVLRKIEKEFNCKDLHLIPAIPAPIAIECGRQLLKGVSPRLLVYDRQSGTYKLIIKI